MTLKDLEKVANELEQELFGETQPIQTEIEEEVEIEKEIMQDELPVETRQADEEFVSPEEYLGKIAQSLFVKKQAMTEDQKEMLVSDINEIGENLILEDNEDISKIGEEMIELEVSDLSEDNKKIATKVASYAKKLIIVGERKMAEENIQEVENKIEEEKLACAEKLVKIAKVLKSKNKELTASQEKTLNKILVKIAGDIQKIGVPEDEDEKLEKSDWNKSFEKTRSKNNKQLKMLKIDWNALSTYGISENAIIKNLTVDQLKRIIMNIK